MINAERFTLHPLATGRSMDVYALSVDGRCEIIEFLLEQYEQRDDFFRDLRNMLQHIAEHGFRTPQTWYRRIVTWPDLWEVRKGKHRLLGFAYGNMLVLCTHRLKRGPELPAADFRQVAQLRHEWLSEK